MTECGLSSTWQSRMGTRMRISQSLALVHKHGKTWSSFAENKKLSRIFDAFYIQWLEQLTTHIFQNAQVTWTKMVHKKRHCFLAQFSIPFHMVWSVLLRALAQKTTFWVVEILYRPIRSFYSMVFEANTRNKTEHTMWKGLENCARKWCLFLCTILFEVTWALWKMC